MDKLKDKIIKLLKGVTKEDHILGLSLIVNNYDPNKFIRENGEQEQLKVIYPHRDDFIRPIMLLDGTYTGSLFQSNFNGFYYKCKEGLYILYTPDALSICYENYSLNLPVIKH